MSRPAAARRNFGRRIFERAVMVEWLSNVVNKKISCKVCENVVEGQRSIERQAPEYPRHMEGRNEGRHSQAECACKWVKSWESATRLLQVKHRELRRQDGIIKAKLRKSFHMRL